jgi:hypothetical protein
VLCIYSSISCSSEQVGKDRAIQVAESIWGLSYTVKRGNEVDVIEFGRVLLEQHQHFDGTRLRGYLLVESDAQTSSLRNAWRGREIRIMLHACPQGWLRSGSRLSVKGSRVDGDEALPLAPQRHVVERRCHCRVKLLSAAWDTTFNT